MRNCQGGPVVLGRLHQMRNFQRGRSLGSKTYQHFHHDINTKTTEIGEEYSLPQNVLIVAIGPYPWILWATTPLIFKQVQ